MGRCAHRPSCLWFVLLHVRLTKPPQIAKAHRLRARRARGGRAGCGRAPSYGDWCRFRAAGRGSDVHPTCGRAQAAARGDGERHPTPARVRSGSPRTRRRVNEIAFRARFLRFVACEHPLSAPFGPSPPASNQDPSAHHCSDLRFCNASSSTDTLRALSGCLLLQRTSKNVHEADPRRRACNEPQKMCSRRPRRYPQPCGGRRTEGARAQPAGARRRQASAERASAESGFVRIFFGLLRDCEAVCPSSGSFGASSAPPLL